MKYLLLIATVSLLLGLGCKKNNDEDSFRNLAGAYSGTFNRTGVADTSRVTLELGDDFHKTYTGRSYTDKYPAICHGSYDLKNNSITFVDSCIWTADFDWTLILNGNYNISFTDNNSFRMWKTNGAITDEYLLRRISR